MDGLNSYMQIIKNSRYSYISFLFISPDLLYLFLIPFCYHHVILRIILILIIIIIIIIIIMMIIRSAIFNSKPAAAAFVRFVAPTQLGDAKPPGFLMPFKLDVYS